MNPIPEPNQTGFSTPSLPNNLPSQSTLGSIGNNVSQAQSALNQLNAPTSNPVAQKQPSLWERLLPTAGSILGGLGAGALDIATGGLAIPFDAALAGGGGALGKLAENALTKQKLDSGVLGSAAAGAIGQGVGEGVGNLIGMGGKALTDAAGNKIAQAGTNQATQAATDEATRIGNEFGAVKPGAADVGPAIAKANSLGITNPTASDLKSIGGIYTGDDGFLNLYKNQALEQGGGTVDLNNTMDNLHQELANGKNPLLLGSEAPTTMGRGTLPVAPNNVATNIVQQVRNILPDSVVNKEGLISEQVSPQEGQALLKSIGSKIEETKPQMSATTGLKDPAAVAENNIWRTVYNNVKQAVYNRPEVDQAVADLKVNPDDASDLDSLIKEKGITDPQVATNIKSDIINTVNNSGKMQDLLDTESPMVNVGKVGNIQTQSDANNPQLPKSVKSAKSQIAGKTGILGKDPLGTSLDVGGVYEGLIKGHPAALLPALAYAGAKNPAILGGAGSLLSRLGASPLPAIASQIVAHSPNDVPTGSTNGTMLNLNQGSTMTPQNSVIGQVLNQDLTAGKESLADPFLAGNYSSQINQLGAILPLVQKILAAKAQEENLAQTLNTAGGAQGPVGGILSRLGQTFTGGPASLLGSNIGNQESALGGSLQSLGASPGMMPQVTQNQTAAQQSLTNINNLLNSLLLPQQQGSTLNQLSS